ncbi:MAG: Hsp20 family protein [Candidatus Paceibacterales bacterium]
MILPVEIDPNRVEASMKEGILTIRMPKILREKKRKIAVKG